MLKVTDFIWQQKTVWHEFVIDWEESLQSADDDAKYVFLCKVVHQWIPIEDTFTHFNDVQIVVPQCHTVP